MRIVFLSRVLPYELGSPLERRFAGRLAELTDLGHEVLILSLWQEELPELQLGKRVEVRYPFRKFAAWEWPQALPLILQWRPDLIHIVDPGLSAGQRLLGAEASVFPVIESLRRGFRRLALPHVLVSTLDESPEIWGSIGARHIENSWLSLRPPLGKITAQGSRLDSDRVRVFLAGTETERAGLVDLIPTILEALRRWPSLEVGCLLDRASLSLADRRRLLRQERLAGEAASRLLLIPKAFSEEALETQAWDLGIVAGLTPKAFRRWQELLAMPLVISEGQRSLLPQAEPRDPRLMSVVSELAWLEQSLAVSQDAALRDAAWSAIHEGAHLFLQDDATNRISRLYATALAESASPS